MIWLRNSWWSIFLRTKMPNFGMTLHHFSRWMERLSMKHGSVLKSCLENAHTMDFPIGSKRRLFTTALMLKLGVWWMRLQMEPFWWSLTMKLTRLWRECLITTISGLLRELLREGVSGSSWGRCRYSFDSSSIFIVQHIEIHDYGSKVKFGADSWCCVFLLWWGSYIRELSS